jgi:hypothetical protein
MAGEVVGGSVWRRRGDGVGKNEGLSANLRAGLLHQGERSILRGDVCEEHYNLSSAEVDA